MLDTVFYSNKRVLVTGHTGFKGSWLCHVLKRAGADVTGFSLMPPTTPALFDIAHVGYGMRSVIGDVRDFDALLACFEDCKPEIVFHLAAQPIVRMGYREPRYTYEVNVMGTVNVLECIRLTGYARSFLNVTTDKVYKNNEWEWGYRENEMLDGYDPYSNSKSCSELVTHCYGDSLLTDGHTAVSTARAGNVIGGGDFAQDRIIPDCIRSAIAKKDIIIRNPYSVRPYQHVLEPIFAYLYIAASQYENPRYAGYYNVGPDDSGCVRTGELAELFCKLWGEGVRWIDRSDGGPHEANFLKLDPSRLKGVLGWHPAWNIEKATEMTVRLAKSICDGEDIANRMDEQISEFIADSTWIVR